MNCRHHPACPGCPLLTTPYTEQLQRKQRRIAEAFALFPHLGLKAPPVHAARFQESYRHRLKLPVHIGNRGVQIGLYDPASHRVLDTPDCPVLAAPLRDALQEIHRWLDGKKGVHALDLRLSAATGELQGVFACVDGRFPGGERGAAQLMRVLPKLVSIAVSRADPEKRRVFGQDPKIIAGKEWIGEAVGDTRYRLFPGAFFQVDPRNAIQLHDLVRRDVGNAGRILDLYSGVGAYARMLARPGVEVVAVESLPAAAEAARMGAPGGVTVVMADVDRFQPRGRFDAAVLNPAREGADPATLEKLAKLVPRLVYVSCGPESLARDLDRLAWHGLRVENVEAVDLFPQTPEVEVVVRLVKGEPLQHWGHVQGAGGVEPSGVIGHAQRSLILVVGDPGPGGNYNSGRWTRKDVLLGHGLVQVEGDLQGAIAMLRSRGRLLAGVEERTQRFFKDKLGLVRPFVHVLEGANRPGRAPLHGDLWLVLRKMGMEEGRIRSLSS